MSFNLSPRQLVDHDATAVLHAVLDAGRCDPTKLTVEVTESTAVLDLQSSTRTVETIRGRGLAIALDDFGVGESSLSRLAELPVDVLKIDRSFVSGLPDSRSARALIESAVGLAHGLELRPHAEGVETAEQAQWLFTAGCVDAQGFGFGRPMPSDDITAMMTSLFGAVAIG